MKFNKLGRSAFTAGLSLAMGLGLTACSRDYVAAFIYAPSAQTGAVSGYAVDYQSGILTQVSGSPFLSQVVTGTTVIASPDGKYIFEIGGSQNSVVEPFGVGTDGKLYAEKTVTLATGDTYPTGAAVDTAGKFLYVTYQYQNGFGLTHNGPGGVNVFPIGSDGNLGTPLDIQIPTCPSGMSVTNTTTDCGINPVALSVTVPITSYSNQVFVHVVVQDASFPAVLTFVQNTSTGGLTFKSRVKAGVTPSFVVDEPTGRYTYVSDKTSNQIVGFQTNDSNGTLLPLPSSPYTTGLYPVSMTIDPRGKFLYSVNYNSNTVSGYTINHADGSLGGVATSTFTSATGPTCAVVDPSVGIYLYTSNYLDNSISGARLTTEDGSLKAVANTPFPTSVQPNCVAAVANGSHSSSIVNPN